LINSKKGKTAYWYARYRVNNKDKWEVCIYMIKATCTRKEKGGQETRKVTIVKFK